MVELCKEFVCFRRSMFATNASNVLWLVVAAATMLSMYVSNCGMMLEAVLVAAWDDTR